MACEKIPSEKKDIYKILYHKWFNQAAEGKISEKTFFEKALTELGFDLPWREARKKHMEAVLPNRPLISYLAGFQKKRVKVLILSKNVPSQFHEGIKACGIRKHFKNVLNTFNLGMPKAQKRTMVYILKRFKMRADETVFTDD